MITLGPNERVELARATGRRMRVEHELVSGSGRVVASALDVSRGVAWRRYRWYARKRQVRQVLADRVRDAVQEGQLTMQQALALRDIVADGEWQRLPDGVRARLEDYLGRPPPELNARTNRDRTIVRVPGGRSGRRECTVMVVEAVAGPGGCTLTLGPVEAE